MEIFEQVNHLLSKQKKTIFKTSEIKELMTRHYGVNENSVIPSDYCYNRTNNGIEFDKHILLYVNRGVYQYIGLNCKYTGNISHQEKGEEEIVVGEWNNGIFSFYDVPELL
jgi:hypothetical protein